MFMRWSLRSQILIPLVAIQGVAVAAITLATVRLAAGRVERQVVEHLEDHLEQLPKEDQRSRAIVEAMKLDEARHGDEAAAAGAHVLPMPIKALMRRVARVICVGVVRPVQNNSTNASVVQPTAAGSMSNALRKSL